MTSKYSMASFFAGIGGFDLGFERAGFKSVYQCELDEYCRNILAHHWPHVKRDIDIKKVEKDDIPKAEIWCAGCPCQDVSLARARPRAGLEGERSGLFYRFADLLGGSLPQSTQVKPIRTSSTMFLSHVFVWFWSRLARLG